MVCLAPVPCGHLCGQATAAYALDDSGIGRDRHSNSRLRTRCVRTNRVLAYSTSHLVVWPAAYQLCRPGLAPLGTEVRHFAVTVSLEVCFTQRVNLPVPRSEAVRGVRGCPQVTAVFRSFWHARGTLRSTMSDLSLVRHCQPVGHRRSPGNLASRAALSIASLRFLSLRL